MSNARKKTQTDGHPATIGVSKIAVLEIDSKQYSLVYDFGAIVQAERIAGCNLLHALFNLTGLTGIELRGLLLGAMTPLNADMTIGKVTAMIRVDTIEAITKALAEAYALSMPKKAA